MTNNWKARALLFYADSGFYARARIVHLFRNGALARSVWGISDDRDTWEHMMALDDVEEFIRPVAAKPVLRLLQLPSTLRSLTLVDDLGYAAVRPMLPAPRR
jgi:putative restriction endonuclease